MEDIIYKLITPILLGSASALLATKLALKKYRGERLWDRKIEAYSVLIDALYEMKIVRDAALEFERHGIERTKEQNEELWSRSRKAREYVNKAAGTASLVLSDECANALTEMEKEFFAVLNNVERGWLEILILECAALDKSLERIKKIARKELQV